MLNCDMNFTVYFPPAATTSKVPVMYYLSGLTCTDENFIQKSGAQKRASELGIALVAPDTSPRGYPTIPGDSDSWDFGLGAGFYLNATTEKWCEHYRMYDYVVSELPALLKEQFGDQLDTERASICGHSMGGHGAITMALKNPGSYKSVSAFSPICNPVNVPWGEKAFTGYLGEDRSTWKQYDSCELMRASAGSQAVKASLPMLVDQGTADNFLDNQLKPETLEAAAKEVNYPLTLRMQDGYDHSYFFISTFISDHLDFHAKALAQ